VSPIVELRATTQHLAEGNMDFATAQAAVKYRKPSSEVLNRLAHNVRNLRKARGYTQERLGKLCRLEKNYISNVEQSTVNITLANLEAIARGLGCAEADLLRPMTRIAS
jgi:transcriptional regulator with XRE-family HTH domain